MIKPSIFLLGILPFFSASVLGAAPVRVAGSDLFVAALEPELKRFAQDRDLEITVAMQGSRVGLEAVEKGEADLALIVTGADDAKPGAALHVLTAGYLTAVFVAPSSVSLTQISFNQLGGVFGSSEAITLKRWGELGVTGPWSARVITPLVARRDALAFDLFRYTALKSPELKATVVTVDDAATLYGRLAGLDEGGLALLATPPPEGLPLKVLLVAKNDRDVAYGPTPENLHSGDYPLRMPVQLVFRKSEAKRLNGVLRQLLADETAPVLLKAGIIPLPVQARNQVVFELESL
jgi:phosphate transport system substrate-binding protein